MSGRLAYRDWWIEYDPPPIPSRQCDWAFSHKDYDGPQDQRFGFAPSLEAAMVEIDARIEDGG